MFNLGYISPSRKDHHKYICYLEQIQTKSDLFIPLSCHTCSIILKISDTTEEIKYISRRIKKSKMNSTRILFILLLSGFTFLCSAQKIVSAKFLVSDTKKGIEAIELYLDNYQVIGINSSGEIAYIDGEEENNFGDVEYEGQFDKNGVDTRPKNGKNLKVTYYDHWDMHDPQGKIKSIGSIKFTYYNKFDMHDEFGTLKSIGNIPVTYYGVFDMHDPKGKVKSIGAVQIKYFNAFDDKRLYGRIKSIKGNSKAVFVRKITDRDRLEQR